MGAAVRQHWLVGLTVLLGALYVAAGIGIFLDEETDYGWGLGILAAGAASGPAS